ncbi:2-amino-4-hydroxy-6-hydroxymethyldihydropteridine diphosphokinase [Undibacterium sp. SXout7W]|uniref:2-amino-4-hydroxy-6- hydroxymethyldihydropteridine diphosphokinase n=1 Tax=Undibacterium sp. SXout7W TaxID=3413049 RepID=UPI003BF2EF6E
MLAYIGIGANLGDASATVRSAMTRLDSMTGSRLLTASSLYSSTPIDSSGDDYINAVAAIETTLEAPALLSCLQAIEQDFGRERPYRNAPRTLDLDLLLYADHCILSETLTVPHPRMSERAFVLLPLLEIAPDIVISGLGPAQAFVTAVAEQGIFRLP